MRSHLNVLLIQPKYRTNLNIVPPPFGLLLIASALRKAGYRPRVIDLNVEPESVLNEALLNNDILYVGFSVITGPVINDAIYVSEKIRKTCPGTPIVWGGPHPSILPEVTVNHPYVDLVCIGEGIRTAVRIADAILDNHNFKTIPGIAYQQDNKTILTGLEPDDLIPVEEMSLGFSHIDVSPYTFKTGNDLGALILTGRGCPYRCSFCWNSILAKQRYKSWRIEKFDDEIKPLLSVGVNKLFFLDSFAGTIDRLEKLGEYLHSKKIKWALQDGCRVDYHGQKTCFNMLQKTGCEYVTFGAESGSQRILDLICKDLKKGDIIRSATERLPSKLGARYHWMIGFPDERIEDVYQTLDTIDMISNINYRSAHNVNMYAPYPGSQLFKRVCQAGWSPPAELGEWGRYRWDRTYPHHKGLTWILKSIQYSNQFYRNSEHTKYSIYSERASLLFKIAAFFFYPFGAMRWKNRFFKYPVEYWCAEKLRKMID